MRGKKKRIILLAVTVAFIWGVFALQAVSAQEKTVVRYMYVAGGSYDEMNDALVPEYEALNPNVDIQLEKGKWNELARKFAIATVAGNPPDIITLPSSEMPRFVRAGLFSEADLKMIGAESMEELKSWYIPGVVDSLLMMGKLYHIPTELSADGLYYNKEHFEEAGISGPPTTWVEAGEIGEKLAIWKNDTMQRAGFWLSGRGYAATDTRMILTPMFQNGLNLLSKDGAKCLLNDQKAVEAIQKIYDLWHKYRTDQSGFLEHAFYWDFFTSGKVSMMMHNNSALRRIRPRRREELEQDPLPFELVTAPIPVIQGGKRATFSFGWGWVVSALSNHKDEAWKAIGWFSNSENARRCTVDWGNFVPRKAPWLDEFVENNPLWKPFVLGMETGVLDCGISNPKFFEIASVCTGIMDRIVLGEELKTILDEGAAEINMILADI